MDLPMQAVRASRFTNATIARPFGYRPFDRREKL